MTDRYSSLTVTLSSDIRSDDAEVIISAIRQLRGVADVTGNVADLEWHTALMRARSEIRTQIWDILYPPAKL